MKLSFRVNIRSKPDWKVARDEKKISDLFLILLPRKFEMSLVNSDSYSATYLFKLEIDEVLSLEEIAEKMSKLGLILTNFTNIQREFTKEELKEVKTRVCFKEILKPSAQVEK